MNNTVLKINHLSKSFKKVDVLNDITLTMDKGGIYGLIGENGAGKTTLMRIIAGLSFPSSGNIELLGETSQSKLEKSRNDVGFVIEYPALHQDMTARENIHLHMVVKNIKNENQIEELIKLVGLFSAGEKKVKHYSLGMKQRLGIAIVLIGNPKLLVLDEPINGLDPVGVVEIRYLLKKLSIEQNITILISSHILSELYQLADNYIILHRGEILKTLTLSELEGVCGKYLRLSTNSMEKAVLLLKSEMGITNYRVEHNSDIFLYECINRQTEIASLMLRNDILVTNLSIEGENLEQYFMGIIKGDR